MKKALNVLKVKSLNVSRLFFFLTERVKKPINDDISKKNYSYNDELTKFSFSSLKAFNKY